MCRAHLVASAADDAAYDVLNCAGGGVNVGLEGGSVVVVVGRHGGGWLMVVLKFVNGWFDVFVAVS